MTDEIAIPPGLPELGRGRHRDPTHGVCLMELAAFLAGAPHSDAPACTHPVLAAFARVVNDGVSDAARSRLTLLAPQLIDTPDTSAAVTAAVVLAVCEPALIAATATFQPKIMRAVRRARRQQNADPHLASTERQLRAASAAAAAAAASVALLAGQYRDETLETLLRDGLDAYGAATRSVPPATDLVRAPDAAATRRSG